MNHSGHWSGHPGAWAAWMSSAMLMVLVTSNPLYHATIALCALVVYARFRSARTKHLDVLLIVGVVLSMLSIPLNLVAGSTGPTEIFVLPAVTFPGWLGSVTLGGRVTAESLLYAVDQSIALMAILCVTCAFNAGVDHFQLLKLTPPGLAQLGVIVSVGLLLVPETLARVRSLREAHTARGRGAGWAAPASLLSLLSDGLDRTVQRAESLDARGFGALALPARPNETAISMGGLVIAAVGAFSWYYAEDARPLAAVGLIVGALMVASMVWRQAARGTARRLFVVAMQRTDVLVAVSALFGAATLLGLRLMAVGEVDFGPFPAVRAPSYALSAAGACLLLLAPLLARRDR